MPDNNGSQSQESTRPRPYVVLERSALIDVITNLFKQADVGLSAEEWDRVNVASQQLEAYTEIGRLPSRNAAHALMQVGRRYGEGKTPPLVAVSERMFKPRQVNVTLDPRVSLS